MEMIFHAANFDERSVHSTNGSAKIIVQPRSKIAANRGATVFRPEDDVIRELRKTAHERSFNGF